MIYTSVSSVVARGVGEKLIKTCANYAKEARFSSIGWQTAADNETAQKLYNRFTEVKQTIWLHYQLPAKQPPRGSGVAGGNNNRQR